jgi:anti-sigma regulatory factor (Ser/Thr protein kinase)
LAGPERFARTGGAKLLEASWVLKTPEEAEVLASLLAECCPKPDRRVGGLIELLINAIEHGNLEITGPGKRALLAEGRWYEELLLRLADPRYAERSVRVSFERQADGEIVFSIEDDGVGFDVAEVLDRELTQNDTRHGRGIALARLMSFDKLSWEGRGNRVVGRIHP